MGVSVDEVRGPGVSVDGTIREFVTGERVIDLINRIGTQLPQVCYHQQLGPIQTCDTCMAISTASPRADAAQREAFDRILGNHKLYGL